MYHYLNDKELLCKMRSLSGGIMQQVCHYLKDLYDIGSTFYLVGSGARDLILQNEKRPVDLDYNLEILRCEDYRNGKYLKECVRKAFNKALRDHCLNDCEDSTSSLTSKLISITSGNKIEFSIDICITRKDENCNYYRLIHYKTGIIDQDQYIWNMAPKSKDIKIKVDYIKKCGKWELVREQYLKTKNRYLTSNDHDHPSFVCYIEVVNNVYNNLCFREKTYFNSPQTFIFGSRG